MKEFSSLFQSIFVIRKVNEFLLTMLKSLLAGEAKESENSVGKIFLSVGPMLKTYSDYVNNYDTIVKNVKELRKSRPKFDGFMKAVETRALRDGKVHFFSYMVSPVQRIPVCVYVVCVPCVCLCVLCFFFAFSLLRGCYFAGYTPQKRTCE